jgi:type 1 glutamine amidotransferase
MKPIIPWKVQPKIRLVGDGPDAPWHPLEPARRELERILQDEFQLDATEDYEAFVELDKSDYTLCICYTDCWNRDLSVEQIAGLLKFITRGGRLLVIHNGISVQSSYELSQMIGARFTGHPPYQSLNYVPAIEGHPLLEGVESFQLDEEPYMFDFDPWTPRNVVLAFEFEGNRYPAAWEHPYGLGQIVYVQPGHHAPTFQSEMVSRLVLNSVRWLINN